MKKKFTISMIIMALLVPTAIFAEDNQQSTATSTVSVEFTADTPTEPVKPVDPTDPTKPLQPEDGGTGNVGQLTIDYVPQFTFGNKVIKRELTKIESTNLNPFVQVTDVRGTGAGWSLQADMSEFRNGNHVLPNAQLVLESGVVKTPDANGKNAPSTSSKIVLNGSDEEKWTEIMNAEDGQGMGTWLVAWLAEGNSSNSKATLNLDTRDARVGSYNSTITWNLIQTP